MICFGEGNPHALGKRVRVQRRVDRSLRVERGKQGGKDRWLAAEMLRAAACGLDKEQIPVARCLSFDHFPFTGAEQTLFRLVDLLHGDSPC